MSPYPNSQLLPLLLFLLLLSLPFEAAAKPVGPPDLSQCKPFGGDGPGRLNCCPPNASTIIDFKPPPRPAQLRVRRAAHLLDKDYIRKYENATRLMRSLPSSHPWNFIQQANVHCAYCSGFHRQPGTGGNLTFQVHGSWLFYPWHRCFLYFYERILGKLIGDDTFALPFWNWDSPAGMSIPEAYAADSNSSLFDPQRYAESRPPAIVVLDFQGSRNGTNLTDGNLRALHGQVISQGGTAELFLGGPYRGGDEFGRGSGSLESGAHGMVHVWVGEDMGNLDMAGRDPIFFAHHANIDRIWEIWGRLQGAHGKPREFNDTDWLDSSFIFWDENMQMVRIRVRDCLNASSLGYEYENVSIPWVHTKPRAKKVDSEMSASEVLEFPVRLESPVRVVVERPDQTVRVEEGEEVVIVDGIEWDGSVFVRFDVYVGTLRSGGDGEREMLAGSFVKVARGRQSERQASTLVTRLMLGLGGALEELGAVGDERIVVKLVPRAKGGMVKVGGVRIAFSS